MGNPDSDGILARLHVSPPRRWLGVVIVFGLGGLLCALALLDPVSLVIRGGMLGLGALVIWLGTRLALLGGRGLELTAEELREASGRRIASVARIAAVDRGALALKPSNGFLLHLSEPEPGGIAWAPGLWWRIGRRVGVGGLASAAEARGMAEILAALVEAEAAQGRVEPE
ncbi:hypothetical protein [Tropicimonas sp. IMCC34043]|uniref:hypothetical protein n=1 Tax=Tropicimonas sp. IMCC34043 TaxID=2248760 RepID=UPI000E25CFD5|nr:hypothetical protein [Tropicimonas sp. IMCC34043]